MTEAAATTTKVKQLAPGDFRFVCVSCQSDVILQAAGEFSLGNRVVGALGWRVLMRDDHTGVSGLRCPRCIPPPPVAEPTAEHADAVA